MDIEKKIEELLALMTLPEKVSLLSGKDLWHSMPIERLNIPSLTMTDGPHGVRSNLPETGRIAGPTTAFPTGISMASTWNQELIYRVGEALGEETVGMDCDILLGPCVNIIRTPLAGRNFETYSEDPYLAGKLGVAFVKGVQSKGVGTSLKHFACNNQEFERFRGSSEIDERTMREIYLPQFEAIVKEAQPWTVMCSYNRINGIYASENYYLLTEILRDEWGFEGVVISDWGANHTIVESVEAGLDIEMPGPARYYAGLLVEAVNNWQIEEETIDKAVRRILRMILKSKRINKASAVTQGVVNSSTHQVLARELAEEAIVLLKNEKHLLPLDEKKIKKIAVIGPNAVSPPISGGGSSKVEPPYQVNIIQGLKKAFGLETEIMFEQGCDHSIETPGVKKDDNWNKALDLARSSDVVVFAAGLPDSYETEGGDRPDMALTGAQNDLIMQLAKVNNNLVVIVYAGAPVTMPWITQVPAVILAYYPGMEGGNALARIISGEVNPSGKLPISLPKKLEDNPGFTSYPGGKEVFYGEGIFVGYRYYEKKQIDPLFPFGFGLSYTKFQYRDLIVPKQVRKGDSIQVSVKVQNNGSISGKESVQLYLEDVGSSLARPVKELKGFAKVDLKPGEEKTVEFTLTERDLSFYDDSRMTWISEPGVFTVHIGSSSKDILLSKDFNLLV
jgi:beta-glucosidase